MRLIQGPMEAGDIEEVERILASIWFPNLLYKPVRSTYYTILGNLAMMKQDFDSAEKHLKMSSTLGSPMPEAEGANKLQLGMMSMQKGDLKQGEAYIRAAIRAGIPDKESEAVAYLSMCQIFMNKREFRAAKDFFRKAKACKPKTQQVLDQLKEIENISPVYRDSNCPLDKNPDWFGIFFAIMLLFAYVTKRTFKYKSNWLFCTNQQP